MPIPIPQIVGPTDEDYPDDWTRYTKEEQSRWMADWFAAQNRGSGLGDFGTDNKYVDDIPSIINPPSQFQQGIGSLIAGRDGKNVYRYGEGNEDGILVGREGLGGDLFDYDTDGDGVPDSYLYDQYEGGKEDRSLVWQPAEEEGGQGVFMYTSPETGVTIPLNPGQKIPGSGYGAGARFVPVGPNGEDYGFYDSEGRALYDEFGRDIDPVTGEQDEEMGAAIRNMDTSDLDPIRQYSGTRPDKRLNINPMPEPEPEPTPEPEPPFVYEPIQRDPVFPDYNRNEDGSIISPINVQENPFEKPAREPIDYGLGMKNAPEGFEQASGAATTVVVKYINPTTGDTWTSSTGGIKKIPEGWEVYNSSVDYQPPSSSPAVPPVNPIVPPPVSPFPSPVALQPTPIPPEDNVVILPTEEFLSPSPSPFPVIGIADGGIESQMMGATPFSPVPAFQQGIGSFVPPPALPTGRAYGAVPTDQSNLSMVPPDQLFGG